jgi:hypothetical protein
LSKLQKHVTNAGNMMNNVLSAFAQLGQKIISTQSLGEETTEEAKKLEG